MSCSQIITYILIYSKHFLYNHNLLIIPFETIYNMSCYLSLFVPLNTPWPMHLMHGLISDYYSSLNLYLTCVLYISCIKYIKNIYTDFKFWIAILIINSNLESHAYVCLFSLRHVIHSFIYIHGFVKAGYLYVACE